MESRTEDSDISLDATYRAVDIAVGYLVRCGYHPADALQVSIQHVAEVYRQGERRTLALANFAIAAIEKEQRKISYLAHGHFCFSRH